MRMLVTGREGQVVRSLIERAPTVGIELLPIGRPELDLSEGGDVIEEAVRSAAPDVVVSAAAYTLVDNAENEVDLAFAINERGPAAIARVARSLKVPLIHLSTDYVFDGSKPDPYVENDPTDPNSVYGLSKLAGEHAVLSEHPNSAVLRTAWVYSPFGRNFVKTMLRLARERDEVRVVGDQCGNPTNALDIADGIIAIAQNLLADVSADLRGVFHMTGTGEASWAEFAREIFEQSASLGGPCARVHRIRTEDYLTAARRPANSRLNSGKLKAAHGVHLPEWKSSLKGVVQRLQQER